MKLKGDTWIGIEGMDNGNPFLIRARENLNSFMKSGLYPNRLDILWPYLSRDKSLMPDDRDQRLMTKVENSFVPDLEVDNQAILAFVTTGNNQKVWYLYSMNVEETLKRINKSLSRFEKIPIQIFSNPDPDWQEYNDIID